MKKVRIGGVPFRAKLREDCVEAPESELIVGMKKLSELAKVPPGRPRTGRFEKK